jgi:hypothetical protein
MEWLFCLLIVGFLLARHAYSGYKRWPCGLRTGRGPRMSVGVYVCVWVCGGAVTVWKVDRNYHVHDGKVGPSVANLGSGYMAGRSRILCCNHWL